MIQYYYRLGFEAARKLKQFSHTHGHSFRMTLAQQKTEASETLHWKALGETLHPLQSILDYSLLNESTGLDNPTDSSLVHWIRDNLATPCTQVRLIGTPKTEYILDAQGMHGCVETILHSSHFLPNVPPGHKCGRLHGHNFGVKLQWHGNTSVAEIQIVSEPVLEKLNQTLLNQIPGLENPTSENLSFWLWNTLHPLIPCLEEVTVFETQTAGSTYSGNGVWECFKSFSMDSAVPWNSSYQGFTYEITLRVSGTLNPALGWIRDFGEIKDVFAPVFFLLDHRALDGVDGLVSSDLADIGTWLVEKLRHDLPEISGVDLWNTESTGMSLRVMNKQKGA
ncbi:MAG: 6-carboxytetrahydropterin synthase [SAR324 cluster bacterium]|nr:6-carboxytetrahydropterin synthase [SAR324 cluster bacterium]